ncbi:MAG: TRAP transporter large permease [Alphaproteobacteria bacterium]|nr:TRAP transporter large permease [Alphaproteobacteria bacterium]
MATLLMLLGLIALVLINVPIAAAIGIVALAGMFALHGIQQDLLNVALAMYEGTRSFPLLSIPLFILAGSIMNAGGISKRLVDFCSALLGSLRGGLAMVDIGVSMFFAEISGSAVADVAATGSILIPAMKKKGYPAEFAAATTSASASLAIIIPPSIPMILYGTIANASIVQLFVSGIAPGILGGIGLMSAAYWYARRYNFPVEQVFSLGNLWLTFKAAAWAFLLPIIILGTIFGGLVTATEGAAVAVAAALFVSGVIYRDIDLKFLWETALDGVVQTAVVMLLIAASALLGLHLTETRVPQQIAQWLADLTNDRHAVLGILNLLFLILGFFLHSAAAIVLVVPIVMPLVNLIGIDPVHFGIIVTLNLAIGQQTPPVASVLITSCSIAKTDIWATSRWNIPYIAVLIAVLLLVTYVPAVPLFLVEYFYR